jgi:hypothetical protein
VIDEVRVTDWDVQIRLRIPLDDPPAPAPAGIGEFPKAGGPRGVSSFRSEPPSLPHRCVNVGAVASVPVGR